MSDSISDRFSIPTDSLPLPLPGGIDVVTANLLFLIDQTPNPRHKFVYQHLVKHLHAFIKETSLSTDEWRTAIQFLTRTGQKCTSSRQEMILLSDVMGVSTLVGALNNPVEGGATESSLLGPFFTEETQDIEYGGSITSHDGGQQMYVEGRVLTTDGKPIADAVIETWETDHNGLYDIQYADRTQPDCRGRLRTGEDGKFGYRAIVPVSYAIPSDGPVAELLISQGRHNMRPNHLHVVVEAPGYHKLITTFYPDGCKYVTSDAVFGVKESLVVHLEQIDDEAEARKRGFTNGGPFKLLKRDIILLTEEQSSSIRARALAELEKSHLQGKDD